MDQRIDIREPLLEEPLAAEQIDTRQTSTASLSDLFQFADAKCWALIFLGGLAAIGVGVIMPLFAIVFGGTLDSFNPMPSDMDEIREYAITFIVLACISFVLNTVQNVCFGVASELQVKSMREAYLSAILRQEIGWFDVSNPSELTSRIKEDTLLIQTGIGERFARLVSSLSMFISGFAVGFIKGWELSLVMLSVLPCLAISAAFLFRNVATITSRSQKLYGDAGAVAEQAISSIRTVTAFNGQEKEVDRYNSNLLKAESTQISAGTAIARGVAVMIFFIFCSYGLGMWFGAKQVADDIDAHCVENCKTGGDVFSVFWSVLMGAMGLAGISPSLTSLLEAKGAAARMYQILRRKSKIDPFSSEGAVLLHMRPSIDFKNVHFAYPSRPDRKVFKGFDLQINEGETVALVGPSGCGKSTVVNLVERFYDVDEGSVLIGGVDLRTLNLKWLRSQIGLVSQEPVLFSGSVADNIAFGKASATREDVEHAAALANAHEFISGFPEGYDTQIEADVTGGQKQRISIARAIVRDPSILILDESTSALDSESESVVQEALDRLLAAKKRTTLVIAHRLSTIRSADRICVLVNGDIVESGKHAQLMSMNNGIYRYLVEQQTETVESHEELPARRMGDQPNVQVDIDEAVSETAVGIESEVPMKEYAKVSLSKLFSYSRPEVWFFVLALVSCTVNGTAFPIFSLLLSNMIVLFTDTGSDSEYLRSRSEFWALMFCALALVIGIAQYLQTYSFTIMGVRLTTRLRKLFFKGVMRQDIAWFDKEENSCGVLTGRLATEVTLIKNLTGQNLGLLLQNGVTFVAALLIAFLTGSWYITLIMCCVLPFLILGFMWQSKVVRGASTMSQEHVALSNEITVQSINSIRTVAAFSMEEPLLRTYSERLDIPLYEGAKKSFTNGLALGYSQFALLATYGLVFWYGGSRVVYGGLEFDQLIRSLMAVMICAQGLGQNSSFFGDTGAGQSAASRVFDVIERVPEIDSESEDGEVRPRLEGSIAMTNVNFSYPSRPDALVLSSLNLEVGSGETLALVGQSGCGKSTVVSLLERFYKTEQGSILVDGKDVSSFNVSWLRSQMGLVSQEPVLFACSIADNIRYGRFDASLEEVIAAAKMANAHDFISEFPFEYKTFVGDRGVQLSGGQKQRIAIARAIIRDPAILLLDESTSALDSESERVVQEALDELMGLKRRTTIVIAHRLSTIRNADSIAVIEDGAVVESGSHAELMSMSQGKYRKLVEQQNGV